MSKYINILNTIWCNYEVPDDLELPSLDTVTDEELFEFILGNNLKCEYIHETATDILNCNRKSILRQISMPTVEILDDDFKVIYDNGNAEL